MLCRKKQSLSAWFTRFNNVLIPFGITRENIHYTLFFKHHDGKINILIIYDDDIVMIEDDIE